MAAGRDCSAPARRWRCPAYLTTLIRIRALFPPIELPQLIDARMRARICASNSRSPSVPSMACFRDEPEHRHGQYWIIGRFCIRIEPQGVYQEKSDLN